MQELKLPLDISFHMYGFFVGLGGLFVLLYVKKFAAQFKVKPAQAEIIFWVAALLGLIGARIYHILSWFSYYRLFPKEILYIWQGGLGILGLIIGGLVGIVVMARKYKIKVFNLLNLFFPPLLLAQAIGRLGNFFNKEAFGPPTNLPWKIFIPPSQRPIVFADYSYFHPTFFYESVLCFVAFMFYFFLLKERRAKNRELAYFLIAYGLIRFFCEFYRFETWELLGLKVAWMISLLMIFSGVILMIKRKNP